MMMSVQSKYDRQGPMEPPVAEIIQVNRPPDKTSILELRVNIEDRDQLVALPLGALEEFGLTGPAAVEELRAIRVALENLVRAVEVGVLDMLGKPYSRM